MKKEFKNIDFEDKNKERVKKILNTLMNLIEQLKLSLSCEEEETIFYEYLNGKDNFELEITKRKYEDLCIDLWNKCIDKVEETIKKAKLKLNDK